MRVAMVGPNKRFGGMSVHVRGLAEGLGKLGDEVVILPKGEGGGPSAGLSYLRQMRSDFDVVHVQGLQYFEPLTAALAAKWTSGPTPVVTAHGFGGESNWWYHGTQRQLMRQLVRRFNGLIAISEYVRRRLESFSGISSSRIATIYNGVDTKFFNPEVDATEFRYRLGLQGSFMILYVGRLAWNKGLADLITSMPEVMKGIPSAKLVICGKGRLEEALKKQVETLNLADKVKFPGAVSTEELLLYYASCDLFVLPSTLEPFGLVLLEAMSMRKPVVATRVGGIPELVTDGENGVLVSPRSPSELSKAVLKLYADEGLRKALAKNARATVENGFTIEQMAWQTHQCYLNQRNP